MDDGSAVNSTVLLVSFAVYTLAIIAVGLYSAHYARRSDEDYFLAGRSLGGWLVRLGFERVRLGHPGAGVDGI